MEIGLQKNVRPRQASVDLDRRIEYYQQADSVPAHAFVATLCPDLLRFFRNQVASRQQAADPLREPWMRNHRVRHTYRPGEPIRLRVYAIARWVEGYPLGGVSRRTRSQSRCCRSGQRGLNVEMRFSQELRGARSISINAAGPRTRPRIRSNQRLSPTSSQLSSTRRTRGSNLGSASPGKGSHWTISRPRL
jgi:hypothetical protein